MRVIASPIKTVKDGSAIHTSIVKCTVYNEFHLSSGISKSFRVVYQRLAIMKLGGWCPIRRFAQGTSGSAIPLVSAVEIVVRIWDKFVELCDYGDGTNR